MRINSFIKNSGLLSVMIGTVFLMTGCSAANAPDSQSATENVTQNQWVDEITTVAETETQPYNEQSKIGPQAHINEEIVTLDEDKFKQFFSEDMYVEWFWGGRGDFYRYDDITEKYKTTKTVVLSDEKAYSIYKSPNGGYIYVYFYNWYDSQNGDDWCKSHAIYRENILSYEDFADVKGKSYKEVAKVDNIVNYYKESAHPEAEYWKSWHLLEDGLLVISYNQKRGNVAEYVTLYDNFTYRWNEYQDYGFNYCLEINPMQAGADEYSLLPQASWYIDSHVTSTTDGFYKINDKDGSDYYISYYDIDTDILGKWCFDKACDHTDKTKCSALLADDIYKHWFVAYGGYMYQLRIADDGGYLVRRNLDGSGFTEVGKLWNTNKLYTNKIFENVDKAEAADSIFIHDGYVYFMYTKDYSKVSLCRMPLDTSEIASEVESWIQGKEEIKHKLWCNQKYIYMYGVDNGNNSFILRYEPDKDTDNITEIYRKTADGQITGELQGNITKNIDDIHVYDDGIFYLTSDKKCFKYDIETKESKEIEYYYGKMYCTYNGEYILAENGSECNLMNGNGRDLYRLRPEIDSFDKRSTLKIIGADSRYFLFGESQADGYFTLDINRLLKQENDYAWYFKVAD